MMAEIMLVFLAIFLAGSIIVIACIGGVLAWRVVAALLDCLFE